MVILRGINMNDTMKSKVTNKQIKKYLKTTDRGYSIWSKYKYVKREDVWAETDESVWVDDGEPYVPPIVPDEPVIPGGPDNPGTTPGAIDPSAGGQDWIIHRVR